MHRIYADVVINHMTYAEGYGQGTGGSSWSGGDLRYPAVPYSAWDFNWGDRCPTSDLNIHSYHNVEQVRATYCLVGWLDECLFVCWLVA